MTKGIEVRDLTIGIGDEAVLGKAVVVNVRMFLNHGTEVFTSLCGSKSLVGNLGFQKMGAAALDFTSRYRE